MDWDGIGTLALFLSSGAIGVGFIGLRAYTASLASKEELARIERAREAPDDGNERLGELEEQVRRLQERLDFTERLLDDGRGRSLGGDKHPE
jgi:hypothetical protein